MDEKVKVSREVAEAVEQFKQNNAFRTFMLLSIESDFITNEDFILNSMPTETLAKVWFGEYEVEPTPAELVADYYHDAYADTAGESGDDYFDGRAAGKVEAIQFFAKTFNIKIPGVNE